MALAVIVVVTVQICLTSTGCLERVRCDRDWNAFRRKCMLQVVAIAGIAPGVGETAHTAVPACSLQLKESRGLSKCRLPYECTHVIFLWRDATAVALVALYHSMGAG